jgi:hypothetical protein
MLVEDRYPGMEKGSWIFRRSDCEATRLDIDALGRAAMIPQGKDKCVRLPILWAAATSRGRVAGRGEMHVLNSRQVLFETFQSAIAEHQIFVSHFIDVSDEYGMEATSLPHRLGVNRWSIGEIRKTSPVPMLEARVWNEVDARQ